MSKVVLSFTLSVKCTMPVENIPAKSDVEFAKEFASEIIDWIKDELADPEVDSEFVVNVIKVDIID